MISRQLVSRKRLRFPEWRRMLDNGNQPDLGHKDKAHVTVKSSDIHQSRKASLALQEHLGRSKGDVSP